MINRAFRQSATHTKGDKPEQSARLAGHISPRKTRQEHQAGGFPYQTWLGDPLKRIEPCAKSVLPVCEHCSVLSKKLRPSTLWMLWATLGWTGAHRLLAGKVGGGLVMLITAQCLIVTETLHAATGDTWPAWLARALGGIAAVLTIAWATDAAWVYRQTRRRFHGDTKQSCPSHSLCRCGYGKSGLHRLTGQVRFNRDAPVEAPRTGTYGP